MSVFIIAEAGSSHDNDLQKAYRLIEAAKECGADAVKFQWTSNAAKMAQRRNLPVAENMYRRYLEKPIGWLKDLKKHCDKVGIEFMCSQFIPEDCDVIASLATWGKISAFESGDDELISCARARFDSLIVSCNPGKPKPNVYDIDLLYCVSKYPTQLEDLKLGRQNLYEGVYDGLSDHTANVLTGAAAVAAGAKILEFHCRLSSTSKDNPDYNHSHDPESMRQYIANVRTVERML